MNDEPYHEPVYYLYENALAQIVGMIELCRREDPATLVDMIPRIREIANSGLMHDFKAIYPGHTEEFHARMRREDELGCSLNPIPTSVTEQPTKSSGQAAYEKYAEFQLRIPREGIRPPTWEEMAAWNNGTAQNEWHEIAAAAVKQAQINLFTGPIT